jgi:osomolarity two-component system sensor histidine kinase TcsA
MTPVHINEHNLKPAERPDNDHRIRRLHSVEQAAPASASDLGRIFSLSPLPTIVLDAKLQVVQVSNSHLVISGYSRAEIVGQSIYDLPAHKVPATDTISLHRVITHAINASEVQS